MTKLSKVDLLVVTMSAVSNLDLLSIVILNVDTLNSILFYEQENAHLTNHKIHLKSPLARSAIFQKSLKPNPPSGATTHIRDAIQKQK